jgi:hypothetical protein
MGATSVDLRKPTWLNPIDTDLDAMRDNSNYVLCVIAAGAEVLPGWATEVDVSLNNNYAQPDAIKLTTSILRGRGTRYIKVSVTWV